MRWMQSDEIDEMEFKCSTTFDKKIWNRNLIIVNKVSFHVGGKNNNFNYLRFVLSSVTKVKNSKIGSI